LIPLLADQDPVNTKIISDTMEQLCVLSIIGVHIKIDLKNSSANAVMKSSHPNGMAG
jgi:hypothetical protein